MRANLFSVVVRMPCCLVAVCACLTLLIPGMQDRSVASDVDPAPGTSSLVKAAEKALEEGRFQEALTLYNRAASAASPSATVFLGRGTAYEMLRKPRRAVKDYDKALELDPANYRAMENLAGIHERGGKKIREAIELYQKALDLDPRPEWKENLAAWIAILKTRLEEHGPSAVGLWNRGNEFLSKGDTESAEKLFTQALELNPLMFQAFFSRGLVRRKKGDLQGAIADFDQCLRSSPAFPGGLVQRALAYEEMGAEDQALEDLERAAEVDCTNAEAHFHLGRIREERKEYDLAFESYRTALKQKSKPELRSMISRRLAAVQPKARKTKQRKPGSPRKLRQLW